MAKLKLPFELEKPSSNEYVTQSSQIGHNGEPLDQALGDLSKLDNISKQSAQSEEQAVVFETDGGVQVGKIDANGADFINLKRGGQQVARMSDLPTVPTLDTTIGDNPSNSHTPSTKAVKDYVDAKQIDLPITEETTASEDEEMDFTNDAGSQSYAKVGSYGVKSKAYLDMNGNSVIPMKDTSIGDNPSTTNVPTTKAVKDYVDAGIAAIPLDVDTTAVSDEEVIYSNNAETDTYAKVGDYGIKSKAYLDLNGDNVIPTKDATIGETPSQTNVPTSKAVADYVDEHSGGNFPISKETTAAADEEIEFTNDAGSQSYVKVGNYGIKAKAFLNMDGTPLNPNAMPAFNGSYRPLRLPQKNIEQPLKILTIGNSYTMNTYSYVEQIASNLGVTNIIFARTHDGGTTFSEEQSSDYITVINDHIIGGSKFYQYKKFGATTPIDAKNEYTIDDVLTDEDWDIIILQNGSTDSASWDLIDPYLGQIIGYIRSIVGHDVVLGFNNTWSWGSHSTLYNTYKKIGGSQSAMDGGLADVRRKILSDYGLITAELGSAIKLLRESSFNNPYVDNATPYEMMESVNSGNSRHLEGAIPMWVASMVFFKTFIAPVYNTDINNCTYTVAGNVTGLEVTTAKIPTLLSIVNDVCSSNIFPSYSLGVNLADRVTITGSIANSGSIIVGSSNVINVSNDKVKGNYSAYINEDKTFAIKIIPSQKESIIKIKSSLGNKTIKQIVTTDVNLGSITL